MNLKKKSIKKIKETKRNYNEKNEDKIKKKIRYEIEKKINWKKGEKQNKYQLKEREPNLI
jgi:hypothetical protein